MTGLSKLARVVDMYARRPQVQERLTRRWWRLEEHLNPRGAIVVIEAEHYCMSMRGVRKPGEDRDQRGARCADEQRPPVRRR